MFRVTVIVLFLLLVWGCAPTTIASGRHPMQDGARSSTTNS